MNIVCENSLQIKHKILLILFAKITTCYIKYVVKLSVFMFVSLYAIFKVQLL